MNEGGHAWSESLKALLAKILPTKKGNENSQTCQGKGQKTATPDINRAQLNLPTEEVRPEGAKKNRLHLKDINKPFIEDANNRNSKLLHIETLQKKTPKFRDSAHQHNASYLGDSPCKSDSPTALSEAPAFRSRLSLSFCRIQFTKFRIQIIA